MTIQLSRSQRLIAVISISSCFFLAEISVGFYTHSLALVADAFHYLNDLVGFIVALVALKISAKDDSPQELSFGWQRAQLLGAFFNGVLLFALGISVFLQSIERFIALQRVQNPMLIFIVGCVGLGLNVLSAAFLHEHDHGHGQRNDLPSPTASEISLSTVTVTGAPGISRGCEVPANSHHDHKHHHSSTTPSHGHGHGHDFGMMGVLIHVMGDAANNLGVMAAALVIWLAHYEGRYYADPAVSMAIAVMILLSSLPIVRRTGLILLESAPTGVDLNDVKHDLEKIPGVHSVHELHIWRLNQQKSLASVHVVISDTDADADTPSTQTSLLTSTSPSPSTPEELEQEEDDDMSGNTRPAVSVSHFLKLAKIINECFHAYGIHSVTLQPEINTRVSSTTPQAPALLLEQGGESVAGLSVGGLRQRQIPIPRSTSTPGSASVQRKTTRQCQIICGSLCGDLTCCG